MMMNLKRRSKILSLVSFAVMLLAVKAFDSFEILPCSQNGVVDISSAHVNANSFKTEELRSLPLCAHLCAEHTQCAYAVYQNATQTCQLFHDADNSTMSTHTDGYYINGGCTIVIKWPMPCQNQGQLLDDASYCTCLREFTGRFCESEVVHPEDTDEWLSVTEYDYPMLASSQVPVKMLLGSEIVTVNVFERMGDAYIAQANNFLGVNLVQEGKNSLVLKADVKFRLCSFPEGSCQTATVQTRDGEDVPTMMNVNNDDNNDDLHGKLFFQSDPIESRVVFDKDMDAIADMVTSLSNGHRILRRDIVASSFYPESPDVVVQNIQSRLRLRQPGSEVSPPDWERPPSYTVLQDSLGTNTRWVLRHTVGVAVPDAVTDLHQDGATPTRWEMDTDWRKLTAPTVSELKTYVANGFEMRVILNGTKSFDVTAIKASSKDVIATLAPYLNPLDPSASMSNVRVITVVSFKKQKLSICESYFQSSTIYARSTIPDGPTVDWVVSTRQWTKVYVTTLGNVTFGNEHTVIQAAVSMKNTRVCTWLKGPFHNCFTCATIKVLDSHGVLCQTYPFTATRDSFGMYNKLGGSDCGQLVRVMSTQGWGVQFRLRTRSSMEESVPTPDRTFSWFVQY